MAKKKSAAATQTAPTSGITQGQSVVLSLLTGPNQQGLVYSGIETAVKATGEDTAAVINSLTEKGWIVLGGNGVYVATRDQTGQFIFRLQQPAAAPQQPAPVEAAGDDDGDDAPWFSDLGEKFDVLTAAVQELTAKLDLVLGRASSAPPPPYAASAPPPSAPLGGGQPPPPYQPMTGQAPQGQPWQQPPHAAAQPPYPAPQGYPQQPPQGVPQGAPQGWQNGAPAQPPQTYGYPVPGQPPPGYQPR